MAQRVPGHCCDLARGIRRASLTMPCTYSSDLVRERPRREAGGNKHRRSMHTKSGCCKVSLMTAFRCCQRTLNPLCANTFASGQRKCDVRQHSYNCWRSRSFTAPARPQSNYEQSPGMQLATTYNSRATQGTTLAEQKSDPGMIWFSTPRTTWHVARSPPSARREPI